MLIPVKIGDYTQTFTTSGSTSYEDSQNALSPLEVKTVNPIELTTEEALKTIHEKSYWSQIKTSEDGTLLTGRIQHFRVNGKLDPSLPLEIEDRELFEFSLTLPQYKMEIKKNGKLLPESYNSMLMVIPYIKPAMLPEASLLSKTIRKLQETEEYPVTSYRAMHYLLEDPKIVEQINNALAGQKGTEDGR